MTCHCTTKTECIAHRRLRVRAAANRELYGAHQMRMTNEMEAKRQWERRMGWAYMAAAAFGALCILAALA